MAFAVEIKIAGLIYKVKWAGGVLSGNEHIVRLLTGLADIYEGVAEVGPEPGPKTSFDFFDSPLPARFFFEYLDEIGRIELLGMSGKVPMPPVVKGAQH